VGNVTYTTQLDCAFYSAVVAATAARNSVALILGQNYYNSCAELVEPTGFYTVDIIGQSMRTSFINKICSTPSRPVIFKGEPVQFGNLVIKDLTIQANNNANSCMDLWGVNSGDLEEIDCIGVINGSDHFVQLGEPGHFSKGGFGQSTIRHLTASSPYSERGTEATVTANVVSGAVTSYTVKKRGAGYSTTDLVVEIYGYGTGTSPCTVLPTARATVSRGAVIAVTPVTNGSGCTGTIDVQVLNLYNVKYGFDLNVSDSLIEDLISLVGTDAGAGLHVAGGNNAIVHAHPTNIPVGIVNASLTNNAYFGTECDTVSHYCFDFEGSSGSSVTGTNTYTNGHVLPGFSDFYFGSGAHNVTFGAQGNLCSNGAVPTDFHEFITQSGPYDTGKPLPAGVSVSSNDESCVNVGNVAGFPASLIGGSVASASTIALTGEIQHVTGTAAITTITPPNGYSSTVGGCVILIADGAWTTTTGSNIAKAVTATAGTSYQVCYDGSKWQFPTTVLR
jgi:hypothetical protein